MTRVGCSGSLKAPCGRAGPRSAKPDSTDCTAASIPIRNPRPGMPTPPFFGRSLLTTLHTVQEAVDQLRPKSGQKMGWVIAKPARFHKTMLGDSINLGGSRRNGTCMPLFQEFQKLPRLRLTQLGCCSCDLPPFYASLSIEKTLALAHRLLLGPRTFRGTWTNWARDHGRPAS